MAERKRFYLIAVFALILAALWGGARIPAIAADGQKTISFTDGSGSSLTYKGKKWVLSDKNGRPLSGVQYLKIPSEEGLRKGFYMFDEDGVLIQEKAVYFLNETVHGQKFSGYYYTNSQGRFTTSGQGVLKLTNLKCGSKTFNGYYYVQEYGRLTADAQVRRIEKKVKGVLLDGFYYFNSNGKLCTSKKFRTVKQKAEGMKFNGIYYFGGENGALVQKAGWVTFGGERYYINKNGKMLTDQWKNGYYLLEDGTIAKSQQVPDGSWVDADGRKCEENEVALSALKDTIASMTGTYGGTWSVYVKNLKTGDVLSYNDCTMYPASTIKVFVMASVFNEIQEGRITETSQIDTLLNDMITVSDNESYNELVRRHTASGDFAAGAAVVNEYLKENGYASTGVHHTLHPSSSVSTGDGGSNISSAKDCGLLLESIYNGQCVSKASSKKMLNLLLNQQVRNKIPAGVPSGIKVANKTGETSAAEHDIAIVYGKKTDYVLCVFSSNSPLGAAGIREISSTVYNYLN